MKQQILRQNLTKEQWLELFQKKEKSNLTVQEFCIQEKISWQKYYSWKKKLLSQSEQQDQEISANEPTQAFIPIQINNKIKPLEEHQIVKIKIKLRNQRLIWIERPVTSVEELSQFLRLLEEDSTC